MLLLETSTILPLLLSNGECNVRKERVQAALLTAQFKYQQ